MTAARRSRALPAAGPRRRPDIPGCRPTPPHGRPDSQFGERRLCVRAVGPGCRAWALREIHWALRVTVGIAASGPPILNRRRRAGKSARRRSSACVRLRPRKMTLVIYVRDELVARLELAIEGWRTSTARYLHRHAGATASTGRLS